MLLGGSGSLGGEGKEAKIDREISICIICTLTLSHIHTDKVWLPRLPEQ